MTRNAQLLFLFLLGTADDEGRGDLDPEFIGRELTPSDPMGVEDTWDALRLLDSTGIAPIYQIEGEGDWYYYVRNAQKLNHVRADRRRKSEYPAASRSEVQRLSAHCGPLNSSLSSLLSLHPSPKTLSREGATAPDSLETESEKEQKDTERMAEYRELGRGLLAACIEDGSPEGMVKSYLKAAIDAVAEHYELKGQTFTPTRKLKWIKRLSGKKPYAVLIGIEIYVDLWSKQMGYGYMCRIVDRLVPLDTEKIDENAVKHRNQMKDGGLYASCH